MFEVIIGFLCFFLLVAVGCYLAGHAERTVLAEMNDACISCYAIWDDFGNPENIYAEEYERRKKTSKEISCNR